ncbi:hypothetical protein EDD11_002967 [Mortierella claussenii]|nr:hypothetical protein EDD11_002967 [Mortierella claussenii]
MSIYSNPDILGADFLRLVNSPIGADVRLIVGEEQMVMHAHSLILQARSHYFARALTSDWKESTQGIIRKPNITPPVFERILQYIYCGRLQIDDEMVIDLIKAADEMCIDDLVQGCERYTLSMIGRTNVLELLHLASQHNLQQLRLECLDFIASNIEFLKRGKPILTLDADVLKEVLSMDQLDLDELEIWKIAVRWAYYQIGLKDWDQCPLLEFPKGAGCVIVQPLMEDGSVEYARTVEAKGLGGDEEDVDDDDAQVPLIGTNIRIGRAPWHQHPPHNSSNNNNAISSHTITSNDPDEDGFRSHAPSVFQAATAHKVIRMPASVHEDLQKQIAPVLSAVRFMRISSINFLRLIEGTGLVPVHLCAKVYRYHSVPSMADPYQASLRRRMTFSTILSKDNKEVVLEWLQAALQGTLAASASAVGYGPLSSSSPSGSARRRAASSRYSSLPPPPSLSTTSMSSSVASLSMASPPLTGSSFSTTSPPLFSPVFNSVSSPPSHSRGYISSNSSPPTGHRSSRAEMTNSSAECSQSSPLQPAAKLPQPPKLILLFRASRDGFDAANFHMACDQRGPTLTVVRTITGSVFGGYNSSSWSSHPSGAYSTSQTNFLFSLKTATEVSSTSGSSSSSPMASRSSGSVIPGGRENAVFVIKGNGDAAAYSRADYGPTFGVGHDLCLTSNCNLSSVSSAMPSTYHGHGALKTALAGSCYFCVEEYEVFLVQSSTSS